MRPILLLAAAAAVFVLTACGGTSDEAARDDADASGVALGGYSAEATARYLSHLDHPILDGRSDDELLRWGGITCEEAHAEGYTPRHTIRDEGGFSDGESLLVSMAAVIELCPGVMTDLTTDEIEELESYFDEKVKEADTEVLDILGK